MARQHRGATTRRRSRVVGVGTAAGAFLAFGMTPAPTAHADLFDLIIDPVVDSVGAASTAAVPDLPWDGLLDGIIASSAA
ncbi:MAG: hypothetical protein ACRDTV_07915, partial [Mycobacterium sp.]